MTPYWSLFCDTIITSNIATVFSNKSIVTVVSGDLRGIFHLREGYNESVKILLKQEPDMAPLSVHEVTRILFCKPGTGRLLQALKEKGHKNDLRISVSCPWRVHQPMTRYSSEVSSKNIVPPCCQVKKGENCLHAAFTFCQRFGRTNHFSKHCLRRYILS